MMVDAAPEPCSRTGFHISSSSLWVAAEWVAPAVVHAVGPVVVAQVGSTIIRSPGEAASMALWIEPDAETWTGALPPIVTVMVSIDCWPLPAVITNSPHCAVDTPVVPGP